MVRSLVRWLLLAAGSAVLGLLLLGLGIYGRYLAAGPGLQPWHRVALADFTAGQADEIVTLDDYRRLEDRLFADLEAHVYQPPLADRNLFNRYRKDSRSDPGKWPVNWNRSFHLQPAAGVAPRGAVLLLHGLTDSPYSMRSIGEHLAARGHEVVGLRLPGHGTAPSGLLSFRIEDMQAALRLAASDLAGRGPPGRPLLLVGYSNGAALAVDYALAVLEGEPLPRPAGLVLISPAIAVSKLAVVGRFKTGLSSLPGFERAAWESIALEFDPYKYTSFTLHAGGETFRLTRRLASRIKRLSGGQPLQGFPPVLVFLSTVDSTVKAGAVAAALLDRLAPDGHELVLFDVNRYSGIQELLAEDPGRLTRELESKPGRSYALSVVTNASEDSLQAVERRVATGSVQPAVRPIGIDWPPNVFSLSHVALPFPPDDPLYGYEVARDGRHVQLGRISVHGENGVLAVPAWALTRQRSNPFHGYLLERVDAFLEAAGGAPPAGP
jgi:alpha-beta hydrolase superfamily lysophospholipase